MDVEFNASVGRHDLAEDSSILSSIGRFLKDNIIDVLEDLTPVENRRPTSRSSSCPRGGRPESNQAPSKLEEPSQSIKTRPLMDTTNLKGGAKSPEQIHKADDEWGWNSPVAPKVVPQARVGAAKKKLLLSGKDQRKPIQSSSKLTEVISTPPPETKKDISRWIKDQDRVENRIKTPSSAEKGLLGAVVNGISVFGRQATDFLNTLDSNFEQIFTGNEQPSSGGSSSNKTPPSAEAPAPTVPTASACATSAPKVPSKPPSKSEAVSSQVQKEASKPILPVVVKKISPSTSGAAPLTSTALPSKTQEPSVLETMMDSLSIKRTAIGPSSITSSQPAAAVEKEKRKVQVKVMMQELATIRKEKEQMARELDEARQALHASDDENLAVMMRQVESLMDDKARLMAENSRLVNENHGLHMLLAFTTEASNAAMGTPDRWKLHNEAINLLSPSPSQSQSGSDRSCYYSYVLASAKKSPTLAIGSSQFIHSGSSVKGKEEVAAVSRSLAFDERLETTREMVEVRKFDNVLFSQDDDDDDDEIDLIVEDLVSSLEE